MLKKMSLAAVLAGSVLAAGIMPAAAVMSKSDCDTAARVAGGDGNVGSGSQFNGYVLQKCAEQNIK